MKAFFGGSAVVVAVLVGLLGLTWAVQGSNFFMFKVFAPKYEQVRRETFEQSRVFNQGMIQEVENMIFQYQAADDAHKAALADLILHRVADYDLYNFPPDDRAFILALKRERMGG